MIVACNTAILDGIYSNAIVLMESGDTIKAYEAFISLSDYKDSSAKAASIHFQYAEFLKFQKKDSVLPYIKIVPERFSPTRPNLFAFCLYPNY